MQAILLEHFHYPLKKFVCDEDGATAIEYSLMAALIGATVLTGQAALGSALEEMYTNAMGIISAALGS